MPLQKPQFLLGPDGAEHISGTLDGTDLKTLAEALADQPRDVAGIRLFAVDALRPFLQATGLIGGVAARALKGGPQPVRALLFDKTPVANWSLSWHQDRVIAVRDRIEVNDYGPWSRKHGALHVAPPFEVLKGMITLRIHLDPVRDDNAPLLIAPGSHHLGKVAEPDISAVIEKCGVARCG